MATTLVIKNANFSANKLATVSFGGDIPCEGITLSDETKTLSAIGESATLTATLIPANTTDTVTWSTSDSNVVNVVDGVITAVSIGEAVITATCGTQTASCAVSVEVVPDFVVVGAFNARKATGGVLNECVTTQTGQGKNGIIAGNSSDESKRTVDRNGGSQGELDSNFRFVPIPIPAGAKRVKLESKLEKSSSVLGMQTRFLWFNSTTSDTGYVGAKCVDGKSGDSNWDQNEAVTSITVDIPDLTGIDSFAVSIKMADYAIAYNSDYASEFELTFLTAATE